MSFRFLGIDLDGTLLNARKRISAGSLAALNAFFELNPGVIAALITGRYCANAQKFWQEINAQPGIARIAYIACANGAQLFAINSDNVLEQIYARLIPEQDVQLLWDLCAQHNLVFMGYSQNPVAPGYNAVLNPGLRSSFMRVVHRRGRALTVQTCPAQPFWKINVIGWPKALSTFADWLRTTYSDRFVIANTAQMMIEITAINTGKNVPVETICATKNIPISERIAIGNSLNDMPMFDVCGQKIAMSKSPRPLKYAATFVGTADFESVFTDYLLPLSRRQNKGAREC